MQIVNDEGRRSSIQEKPQAVVLVSLQKQKMAMS